MTEEKPKTIKVYSFEVLLKPTNPETHAGFLTAAVHSFHELTDDAVAMRAKWQLDDDTVIAYSRATIEKRIINECIEGSLVHLRWDEIIRRTGLTSATCQSAGRKWLPQAHAEVAYEGLGRYPCCDRCGLFRIADDLGKWYCAECCIEDEDPRAWCDCRIGEKCKGPCSQRAHDHMNCPYPHNYLSLKVVANA